MAESLLRQLDAGLAAFTGRAHADEREPGLVGPARCHRRYVAARGAAVSEMLPDNKESVIEMQRGGFLPESEHEEAVARPKTVYACTECGGQALK